MGKWFGQKFFLLFVYFFLEMIETEKAVAIFCLICVNLEYLIVILNNL